MNWIYLAFANCVNCIKSNVRLKSGTPDDYYDWRSEDIDWHQTFADPDKNADINPNSDIEL